MEIPNPSESDIMKLHYAIYSLKEVSDNEKSDFLNLIERFFSSEQQEMVWSKIQIPTDEVVVPYEKLIPCYPLEAKLILNKLVVLKMHTGPKLVPEVCNGLSFLDSVVNGIKFLNSKYGCNIPLLVMTSFDTHDETQKSVGKFSKLNLDIHTFNQSQYPYLGVEDFCPLPCKGQTGRNGWYVPGDGDVFSSLNNKENLDALLDEGKEYVFIANSDNWGATIDLHILKHLIDKKIEYCMEVCSKTSADVEGGTPILYEGKVKFLEISQVPHEHVDEFKSTDKFKSFNINNLWVNLEALKKLLEADELNLRINLHTWEVDGVEVIKLETAAAAAIEFFVKAVGIIVPSSRFQPLDTSELLLVQDEVEEAFKAQIHDSSEVTCTESACNMRAFKSMRELAKHGCDKHARKLLCQKRDCRLFFLNHQVAKRHTATAGRGHVPVDPKLLL